MQFNDSGQPRQVIIVSILDARDQVINELGKSLVREAFVGDVNLKRWVSSGCLGVQGWGDALFLQTVRLASSLLAGETEKGA